jgi:hypothetical protein
VVNRSESQLIAREKRNQVSKSGRRAGIGKKNNDRKGPGSERTRAPDSRAS